MGKFEHYYNYSEIEQTLREYAALYPGFVRLTSLCHTEEGRELLMAELTDSSTGGFDEKPAFYLVGQFHCKEMAGVMCSLHFMDYLLSGAGLKGEAARMLKDYCVCIIPTATPDGLEHALAGGIARSVNKFSPPRDELPRSARLSDLDGDGVIRFMRIRDPNGPWKISSDDERIMVRREPYEFEGDFYAVFREGLVKGDPERCRFDAPDPYGNDFNRSFPYNWSSGAEQPGGGRYPMENTEVRALVELLNERSNICAFVVLHTATGCTFYPPAAFSPESAPAEDMQRYVDMANVIREETGFPFSNLNDMSARDKYPTHGSFDDYSYLIRGIFTYAIELWDISAHTGSPVMWQLPKNEPGSEINAREVRFFKWMDENCPPETFKPWTKFEHPQLGEVEIGGVDTLHVQLNPPLNLLGEEMERSTRCLMKQLPLLPKLELEGVQATRRPDGLYSIRASVVNRRYLPTSATKQAELLRTIPEDSVSLSGEGIEFVGCASRIGIGFLPGMSGVKTMGTNGRYINAGLERLKRDAEWVIRAPAGTKVTVYARSARGGACAAKLTLG